MLVSVRRKFAQQVCSRPADDSRRIPADACAAPRQRSFGFERCVGTKHIRDGIFGVNRDERVDSEAGIFVVEHRPEYILGLTSNRLLVVGRIRHGG